MFTVPLIPIVHFVGLNDTGAAFALEWFWHFPDEGPGGKCNKEFWSKWVPRRMVHGAFVLSVWALVWVLGAWPYEGLRNGWKFMLTVSFFGRVGFSAAWIFITNFTHSIPWNEFLASHDLDRTWPTLHNCMAVILGGRHRWNEMLFHDLHHAFPNAVGTLSQRGRFHGWKKVHDASVDILYNGLWRPNGDEPTDMEKHQRNRSAMLKQGRDH